MTSFWGAIFWSTLYQKRPMSVLQALRIAASWRLTSFRRIPYQLFLVPDFYRCFGINSMNINKFQVLHHMFNFVVPSRQGGIMTIWKPERFQLPPNRVVSYQACQRVAREVLKSPICLFSTLTCFFSLACWSQLSRLELLLA